MPKLIPLLLVLLMPPSVSANAAHAASPASFIVLEQGSRSGISGQRFETIRDKTALHSLWQQHGKGISPQPAMPEVDFNKDMVVAAYAGQKTTDGYQLNLVGLNRGKKQIDIRLSLTQPGPDCIVTQIMTQPYLLVKIAKSKKPVNFQLASKTFSCVTGKPL